MLTRTLRSLLLIAALTTPTLAHAGGSAAGADERDWDGDEEVEEIEASEDDLDPVVNGTAVSGDDWEDAAAVYLGNYPDCTGVLIAPDVALTAGHCNSNIRKVKLGARDAYGSGEEITVTEATTYPNHGSTYDITVLELAEEAETEHRIIALDCILDDYLENGADVAVVGFGSTTTSGSDYNTTLMEGFTEVLDADCTNNQYLCNNSVSPGGEVVAGGNGVDSCYGDSGGPLYLLTPEGDFLLGITSRAATYNGPPCGDGGIYVRPDALIDWIEGTTGRTLDRPDCDGDDDGSGSDGGGDDGGGDDGGGDDGEDDSGIPDPEADDIYVRPGKIGETRINPNDSNDEDGHTFTIVEEPELGTAELSGAKVTYEAGVETGEDSVTVAVEDPDGNAVEITIGIEIVDDDSDLSKPVGGCGCSTGAAPATGLYLLSLLGMLGMRRRK